MTPSTSTPHVERESALPPFPSVARLVAALGLISVGCLSWHYTGLPSNGISPLAFSAAGWLLISRTTWQRRLTARDYLGALGAIGMVAVLIVATHGRESPATERFLRHPLFLTVFWLLSCSLCIGFWRRLRRSSRAASNPPANA